MNTRRPVLCFRLPATRMARIPYTHAAWPQSWKQRLRHMGLDELYEHQIQVLDLVHRHLTTRQQTTGKVHVIWMNAPTGSGKTLAAYLPVLLDERFCAMGIYPTNALIRDQFHILLGCAQRLYPDADRMIRLLHADAIDRGVAEIEMWLQQSGHVSHIQRIGIVKTILMDPARIVLTNPDIVFYIAFFLYHSLGGEIWDAVVYLLKRFDLWVLDEFHLYDALQQAMLFWILAVRCRLVEKPAMVLLMSATPRARDRLYRWTQTLGMTWHEMTVRTVHEDPPAGQSDPRFRVVQEPLHLTVHGAPLDEWQDAAFFTEHLLPEWTHYLENYPEGKALFLLESVADTLEFYMTYRNRQPKREVAAFTGVFRIGDLTDTDVVGNATLEVGIDLVGNKRKDFLATVARSAEQAIQRVGRIGRAGRPDPFPPNHVHLVVPTHVFFRLEERLQNQTLIPRATWMEQMTCAFRIPTDFAAAATQWGPIATYTAFESLVHMLGHTEEGLQTRNALETVFRQWWHLTPEEAHRQIGSWIRHVDPERSEIAWREREPMATLLSFRGGYPQVIVSIRMDEHWTEPTSADLFWIIRKCDVLQIMSESEFLQWCQKTFSWDDVELRLRKRAFQRARPVAYARVRVSSRTRPVRLCVQRKIYRKLHRFRLQFSGKMWDADAPELCVLLSRCEEQDVHYVGYLVPHTRSSEFHRLPHLFPSFQCYYSRTWGGERYLGRMFIGRDALLVSSLFQSTSGQ